MATQSQIFTEMVTTTDRTWGQKITDNVSKHNALLARLKKKGKIKTEDGRFEATVGGRIQFDYYSFSEDESARIGRVLAALEPLRTSA